MIGDVLKWLEIIMLILELIADGMSRGDAVSIAAKRFGVSEDSIWQHGGF